MGARNIGTTAGRRANGKHQLKLCANCSCTIYTCATNPSVIGKGETNVKAFPFL